MDAHEARTLKVLFLRVDVDDEEGTRHLCLRKNVISMSRRCVQLDLPPREFKCKQLR